MMLEFDIFSLVLMIAAVVLVWFVPHSPAEELIPIRRDDEIYPLREPRE